MTVMLYNDPHPVHRSMANAIGASFVPAEQGGVLQRFKSAISSNYHDNIILEGGVPLVEGVFIKLLRRTDKNIILLAADETIQNQIQPLPYYTRAERIAHHQALKHIDGAIAVSDTIADAIRQRYNKPVTVSEPYILDSIADDLEQQEPGGNRHVISIGENRPAMNYRSLVMACAINDRDLILAGTDTDALPHGRGYVNHDELLDIYDKAGLFCFPALAGAFPVTTLEALLSGTPIMVSANTGTAGLARELDERLVIDTDASTIADAIRGFFDRPKSYRHDLASRSKQIGQKYRETEGKNRFKNAYTELLDRL